MREKQMKKKIRCPECSDTWITMWRSGEMGYRAYYDEILQEVTYDEDTLEYDELAFEIFSCSCGYQTKDDSDILVEVKE